MTLITLTTLVTLITLLTLTVSIPQNVRGCTQRCLLAENKADLPSDSKRINPLIHSASSEPSNSTTQASADKKSVSPNVAAPTTSSNSDSQSIMRRPVY